MDRLALAREIAMSLLWRPYLWGGDNPIEYDGDDEDIVTGFDCSGLIIEILKSVGKLPRRGDWRARDLQQMFPRVQVPMLGCLVFYGDPATHVEFCLDEAHAIGASGGGSATTDLRAAVEADAYVMIRPARSRAGLWGYVDPFVEDR